MNIAGIQLSYSDDESVEARRSRVSEALHSQQGKDLLVLPELWAPGGFSYREWEKRAEPLDGPTFTMVSQAAAALGAVVHGGSIIERAEDGRLYNTSAVFDAQGNRVAVYRKIHRFGFGVGEPRLLQPGEDVVTVDLNLGGTVITTGLATCYDLRFPELFRALLDRGARLLLVPAAWPAPRAAAWELFLRARAAENQMVVLGVNTAGTHAGHKMAGRSLLAAADGTVLKQAGKSQETIEFTVDVTKADQFRELFPVLRDRRPEVFAAQGR